METAVGEWTADDDGQSVLEGYTFVDSIHDRLSFISTQSNGKESNGEETNPTEKGIIQERSRYCLDSNRHPGTT